MYPLLPRLNLTLAGLGNSAPAAAAAPPPPLAPAPAAPVAPSSRKPTSTAAGGGQTTPANVRNKGGARGLDVLGTTTRALKSLTGQ